MKKGPKVDFNNCWWERVTSLFNLCLKWRNLHGPAYFPKNPSTMISDDIEKLKSIDFGYGIAKKVVFMIPWWLLLVHKWKGLANDISMNWRESKKMKTIRVLSSVRSKNVTIMMDRCACSTHKTVMRTRSGIQRKKYKLDVTLKGTTPRLVTWMSSRREWQPFRFFIIRATRMDERESRE